MAHVRIPKPDMLTVLAAAIMLAESMAEEGQELALAGLHERNAEKCESGVRSIKASANIRESVIAVRTAMEG